MNKDIKIARLEKQLATAKNDNKTARAEIRKLKRELKDSSKKKGTRIVVLKVKP